MDVSALTNTAQTIADANVHPALTIILLGIIAVVNVINIFVKLNNK